MHQMTPTYLLIYRMTLNAFNITVRSAWRFPLYRWGNWVHSPSMVEAKAPVWLSMLFLLNQILTLRSRVLSSIPSELEAQRGYCPILPFVLGRAQTETQVFLTPKSLFFPLGYTVMDFVSDLSRNHTQFSVEITLKDANDYLPHNPVKILGSPPDTWNLLNI